MASQSRDLRSWFAVAALALIGISSAFAAPSIQAVYTDHSSGGTPLSINIVGSGFTCPDCGPPRVALGGLSLTVKAHTAKVITAVLPQPVAAGDYTLAVTTGPAARAEVARFSLSVAPVMPGRSTSTTFARSTVRADAMPPPPDLLRGASPVATRKAGPRSRSGRSSGKTSAVAAADPVSTAGTVVETTLDQVVSGLPEYNTAYGEYALFDLSRGYNSGTRGNSAFGYGALLKTTSGSYNNGFGFYALYNNVEGGFNSAFGNWAMYSNTSGVNNSAFGHEALYSNTTGVWNTASGSYALRSNTMGNNNTASGTEALYSNTVGQRNTGSGVQALRSNTTGGDNTASGFEALHSNTTGNNNTASGANALFLNTTGYSNTAIGVAALYSNTTGSENTASGIAALWNNTTGSRNAANGFEVLYSNTTGNYNTASGGFALRFNTTGNYNTASGYMALYSNSAGGFNTANGSHALSSNTAGLGNTASGSNALSSNTAGSGNTASGASALQRNTTGTHNTASGYDALSNNTTGDDNTASGEGALYSNTTGIHNTASGVSALWSNTTGNYNTASGYHALSSNTTASGNTALGYLAGQMVSSGGSNIHIGALNFGLPTDSGVIRLGIAGFQTRTFIAGIRAVTTGQNNAVPVLIDSDGQLGTASSSRRFKEDIEPIGSVSERLFALRPVTFRYKQAYQDGSKPVQFGLIAEEVAEVFPELAVYGQDGRPETVSYHLLATLLLNELQKEHRVSASLQEQVSMLKVQNKALAKANEAQVARMAALEQQVAALATAVGPATRNRMVASAR